MRTLGEESKVVKMKVQDAILTSFTLLTALLRKLVWAGATPGSLWPRHGAKNWVAPAQQGVLPVAKSKAAPCATLMLPTTSRHPQVTRTVTQRVTCLVCSSVTAPNYLKVTTVEGRSQEHRKPVDGIADGWNGSCFEQAAGMCSDELERMDLHIGGTKGSESVKMVCRNHS